MSCSDPNIGHSELERVRHLYGPEHSEQQLKFSTLPTGSETLENLFLQAQQNFGNINLIVNSRTQRTQDFDGDVQALAVKYMGGQQLGGEQGGILLNVQSEGDEG